MPDLRRTATVLASCWCFAGALAAQGEAVKAGPEREAGVLAVLRRLDTQDKQWLANSTFAVARTPLGGIQVLPQIPISCGNSRLGVFDAAQARKMARELFAVYRLDAKADVPLREAGVETMLDGYDAGRRVGFKLRGRTPPTQTLGDEAMPEEARADLADEELVALQKAGFRVHVADLKDYPLMDGDQYTPALAWLASVVAFLDEVTDGRDVALDAVLWQRQQRFPLGPLPAAKGVSVQDRDGMRVVEVAETVTWTLPIDGSGCEERTGTEVRAWKWEAREQPIPTAGQPTRVTVSIYADLKTCSLRITQKIGAGPAIDVEAAGMSVLMPSAFDGGKPFSVVLKLGPGTYHMPSHIGVGCPRR